MFSSVTGNLSTNHFYVLYYIESLHGRLQIVCSYWRMRYWILIFGRFRVAYSILVLCVFVLTWYVWLFLFSAVSHNWFCLCLLACAVRFVLWNIFVLNFAYFVCTVYMPFCTDHLTPCFLSCFRTARCCWQIWSLLTWTL